MSPINQQMFTDLGTVLHVIGLTEMVIHVLGRARTCKLIHKTQGVECHSGDMGVGTKCLETPSGRGLIGRDHSSWSLIKAEDVYS